MERPFLEMILVLKCLLVALVLLGSADAQVGPTGACVPVVHVQKKTVFKGSVKSSLKILCPVRYCEEIPNIKWLRLDTADNWIPISEADRVTVTQETSTANEKEVVSVLSFKNLLNQDDGLYRCKAFGSNSSSESHNINVSVSDTILESANGTSPSQPERQNGGWMPYIIICASIFGLVTVVMVISFLSLHGCKCSKNNNQNTQIPPSLNISDYDSHFRGQGKPEQRKEVFNTSRETLQPDAPSLHPSLDRNTQHKSSDERGQQEIIYASLEPLTPREPSLISQHSREHLSEYASIRIS